MSGPDGETTCWRVEQADRAALIIDAADYLKAARSALLKARSTIHLLNWAFDPATPIAPEPGGGGPADDRFGPFLRRLACERPELDVRILCWRSALPIAATQHFFPHRAKQCFADTPVHFRLDATVPLGACHHQKMIIVDDALAFAGGCDIGPDRWDTPEHPDDDPRRRDPDARGKPYPSRHEVMSLVEGGAARALGELFRDRWLRATGNQLAPATQAGDDLWPPEIAPQFGPIPVGIARTQPEWRGWPEARECEALYLREIRAARRCIYIENQYITSPVLAAALARRLSEPDGPEVILISTVHSPSWFDRMTMDRTRALFLKRLQAADTHGRMHAFVPFTEHGKDIIVHAKLAIFDDRLLRVGSANLNNRSGGFDTECDLTFEAGPDDRATQAVIGSLRTRLLAHWLGCAEAEIETAAARAGGFGAGVEQLRRDGRTRLAPLRPEPLGPLARFIAAHHLGDPVSTADSWRPWRRRKALRARLAEVDAPVAEFGPLFLLERA